MFKIAPATCLAKGKPKLYRKLWAPCLKCKFWGCHFGQHEGGHFGRFSGSLRGRTLFVNVGPWRRPKWHPVLGRVASVVSTQGVSRLSSASNPKVADEFRWAFGHVGAQGGAARRAWLSGYQGNEMVHNQYTLAKIFQFSLHHNLLLPGCLQPQSSDESRWAFGHGGAQGGAARRA